MLANTNALTNAFKNSIEVKLHQLQLYEKKTDELNLQLQCSAELKVNIGQNKNVGNLPKLIQHI